MLQDGMRSRQISDERRLGLELCDRADAADNKPIRHVVCAGALGWVKVIPLSCVSLRTCTRHVDSINPGKSNQYI